MHSLHRGQSVRHQSSSSRDQLRHSQDAHSPWLRSSAQSFSSYSDVASPLSSRFHGVGVGYSASSSGGGPARVSPLRRILSDYIRLPKHNSPSGLVWGSRRDRNDDDDVVSSPLGARKPRDGTPKGPTSPLQPLQGNAGRDDRSATGPTRCLKTVVSRRFRSRSAAEVGHKKEKAPSRSGGCSGTSTPANGLSATSLHTHSKPSPPLPPQTNPTNGDRNPEASSSPPPPRPAKPPASLPTTISPATSDEKSTCGPRLRCIYTKSSSPSETLPAQQPGPCTDKALGGPSVGAENASDTKSGLRGEGDSHQSSDSRLPPRGERTRKSALHTSSNTPGHRQPSDVKGVGSVTTPEPFSRSATYAFGASVSGPGSLDVVRRSLDTSNNGEQTHRSHLEAWRVRKRCEEKQQQDEDKKEHTAPATDATGLAPVDVQQKSTRLPLRKSTEAIPVLDPTLLRERANTSPTGAVSGATTTVTTAAGATERGGKQPSAAAPSVADAKPLTPTATAAAEAAPASAYKEKAKAASERSEGTASGLPQRNSRQPSADFISEMSKLLAKGNEQILKAAAARYDAQDHRSALLLALAERGSKRKLTTPRLSMAKSAAAGAGRASSRLSKQRGKIFSRRGSASLDAQEGGREGAPAAVGDMKDIGSSVTVSGSGRLSAECDSVLPPPDAEAAAAVGRSSARNSNEIFSRKPSTSALQLLEQRREARRQLSTATPMMQSVPALSVAALSTTTPSVSPSLNGKTTPLVPPDEAAVGGTSTSREPLGQTTGTPVAQTLGQRRETRRPSASAQPIARTSAARTLGAATPTATPSAQTNRTIPSLSPADDATGSAAATPVETLSRKPSTSALQRLLERREARGQPGPTTSPVLSPSLAAAASTPAGVTPVLSPALSTPSRGCLDEPRASYTLRSLEDDDGAGGQVGSTLISASSSGRRSSTRRSTDILKSLKESRARRASVLKTDGDPEPAVPILEPAAPNPVSKIASQSTETVTVADPTQSATSSSPMAPASAAPALPPGEVAAEADSRGPTPNITAKGTMYDGSSGTGRDDGAPGHSDRAGTSTSTEATSTTSNPPPPPRAAADHPPTEVQLKEISANDLDALEHSITRMLQQYKGAGTSASTSSSSAAAAILQSYAATSCSVPAPVAAPQTTKSSGAGDKADRKNHHEKEDDNATDSDFSCATYDYSDDDEGVLLSSSLFWGGRRGFSFSPAIPPSVPPLDLSALLLPDDEDALRNYPIPLPTAVENPREELERLTQSFAAAGPAKCAQPSIEEVHSAVGSAYGGNRRGVFRDASDALDGGRARSRKTGTGGRSIHVALLLLCNHEQRQRRELIKQWAEVAAALGKHADRLNPLES